MKKASLLKLIDILIEELEERNFTAPIVVLKAIKEDVKKFRM